MGAFQGRYSRMELRVSEACPQGVVDIHSHYAEYVWVTC